MSGRPDTVAEKERKSKVDAGWQKCFMCKQYVHGALRITANFTDI